MTELTELGVCESWLASVLSGDSTLMALAPGGVHGHVVNDDELKPLVLFTHYTSSDVRGLGLPRAWVDATYIVRGVVDATTFAVADQIAKRIDTLLQGASGTVGDGKLIGCDRLRPFTMDDPYVGNDGLKHQLRHRGGFYRLLAR